MMEGIILDVELDDVTKIYFLRKGRKEVIKIDFQPVIYVSESDFYKFEELFSPVIIDVEFTKKRIGFSDEKVDLVGIRVSYRDYIKLRELQGTLSFNIYHLDLYEEHLLIEVPSINPVSIRVNKKIQGEYLWGLNTGVPDYLKAIELRKKGYLFIVNKDGEEEVYLSLQEIMKELNPSIIVTSEKIDFPGIITLDPLNHDKYGVAGLMEKAYFSCASPRRVVGLTIGNSIESRQERFALDAGMVLPIKENENVQVGRLSEYLSLDVGGLIITPDPGVYENIVALDFTSMFPSIILRYNISYETCGLRGTKKIDNKAFLPHLIEEPYARRLFFKKINNDDAKRRAKALKLLLAASYGYAGKLDNRFGNMYCNFWINKMAREIMLKVIELAKDLGLNVVYADTDSVFVSRNDKLELFISKIKEMFNLPIKIEHDFRKVVFIRGVNKQPVVKRYFGLTRSGELVIKGLMAISSNVPFMIRTAQKEMMRAMLNKKMDFIQGIYESYRSKLLNGDVTPDELAFNLRVGKNFYEYKNNSAIARVARRYRLRKDSLVEVIYSGNNLVMKSNYRGIYNVKKYLELLDKAKREIFPGD